MKILYLSTLSLIAVMLMPTGAYAHCEGKHTGNHPHCQGGGGGGDTQTTFEVYVTITDPTPATSCTGTAETGLTVQFVKNSCKIYLDGLPYCLFQLSVKNTRKETSAMLFFTNFCGFDPTAPNDSVYNTGRIPAEILVGDSGNFTITVTNPQGGVVLTKVVQPDKGSLLDEKIFVGDIVYTAQ
jgi:hypothetical protein